MGRYAVLHPMTIGMTICKDIRHSKNTGMWKRIKHVISSVSGAFRGHIECAKYMYLARSGGEIGPSKGQIHEDVPVCCYAHSE